jgi:hypothetical protein
MGKDLNLAILTKDRISAYRRSSAEAAALQVAERLKIAERRTASSSLRLTQLSDEQVYVSKPLAVDNRYKAGTLSIDADGAGNLIVITGRNADGKAHSFGTADPGAAGATLSKSETWGATGVLATLVRLATTQHARTIDADGAGATLVITGRDGKPHIVEVAAGAAFGTSVVFDASGVATIVITTNNGVTTVAEVLAALNTGVVGTLVSAVAGTATGLEIAAAVAAGALAGGGVPNSTIAEVIALLNQGASGQVASAAIGDGLDDQQTAVAVAAAPLASMAATDTAAASAEFGYLDTAGTAVRGAAIVSSAAGADGSSLAVTNQATGLAILNAVTIDAADTDTVKAATIATAAVPVSARLKATLTAAPGANVEALAQLHVKKSAGAGSYVEELVHIDRKFRVLALRVDPINVPVGADLTIDLAVGGTAVISQLTLTNTEEGTVQTATLTSDVEFASGAVKATIATTTGYAVEIALHLDYAVLGTGLQTL